MHILLISTRRSPSALTPSCLSLRRLRGPQCTLSSGLPAQLRTPRPATFFCAISGKLPVSSPGNSLRPRHWAIVFPLSFWITFWRFSQMSRFSSRSSSLMLSLPMLVWRLSSTRTCSPWRGLQTLWFWRTETCRTLIAFFLPSTLSQSVMSLTRTASLRSHRLLPPSSLLLLPSPAPSPSASLMLRASATTMSAGVRTLISASSPVSAR